MGIACVPLSDNVYLYSWAGYRLFLLYYNWLAFSFEVLSFAWSSPRPLGHQPHAKPTCTLDIRKEQHVTQSTSPAAQGQAFVVQERKAVQQQRSNHMAVSNLCFAYEHT